MRTAAANPEAEQRRLWAEYAAALQGLQGPEYDRAEAEAWDALQTSLRGLDIAGAASDDRAV